MSMTSVFENSPCIFRNGEYQEILGKHDSRVRSTSEEVVPPSLVLVAEDLIKDQKGALMDSLELGKAAGEGDSYYDCTIVCVPLRRRGIRIIVVHAPDA